MLPTMLSCRHVFAFAELSIGRQTREFGGGPGSAWRAIVRLARTEHEVLAVRVRIARRAEQLDVVDLLPIGARDAFAFKRIANTPSAVGQPLDVLERRSPGRDRLTRKNQLPPHATSAGHAAVARNSTVTALCMPVARHVFHRNFAARAKSPSPCRPAFRSVLAGPILPRCASVTTSADGTVAAHAQVSDVVEEDYARRRRRTQQVQQATRRRAHRIPAVRSRPPNGKGHTPSGSGRAFGHCAFTQIRSAFDYHSGRLAAGVRIDHLDRVQLSWLSACAAAPAEPDVSRSPADDPEYFLPFGSFNRQPRRSNHLGSDAALRHRQFDVCTSLAFVSRCNTWRVPAVQLSRLNKFAGRSADPTGRDSRREMRSPGRDTHPCAPRTTLSITRSSTPLKRI